GTSSGGEGSTPYQTGITGNTFTDTSVSAAVTYYYMVQKVTSGGSSALSGEASATPLSTTTVYKIVSVTSGSGMVLDANGSTANSSAIVQNPDNSTTDLYQQWNIVSLSVGSPGYFKLVN